MSISKFKAALKGGGARANRFEVLVSFPGFAGTNDAIRKTAFLCSSTQLPGSTLGVIEQPFRGRTLKLAGDRVFDEWEVTFVNDTDFDIRNSFERWHNFINSYNSNTGSTIPDEYMSTVTIYQLDNSDNRIKEYTLLLAWPSVVAPIEVAQDSNDQLELFSVTFVYSDLANQNNT
ncbi:T4-like virus tail tube protein gp19 [compost metagenome]